MKIEKRKRFTREEFARLLSEFAREITDKNRIVFEDIDVSLPDSFEAELEYKEKKGYAKFEIEVFWDMTAPSIGPYPARREDKEEGIPGRFKDIKKGMEKKLYDIENMLTNGNKPSGEDLNYFMKLMQAFWLQTEPDWIPSMNELQKAIDSMVNAVETGDFPLALDRIREINNIKHRCHQVFR